MALKARIRIAVAIAIYTVGFGMGIYIQRNVVFHANYSNTSLADFTTFRSGNDLAVIVLNNFVVALFLSLLGYLSGGIITIITLFWNGMIFSFSIIQAIHSNIPTSIILKAHLIYVPLEIFSFALFSSYGLRGLPVLGKVLLNKPIHLNIPAIRLLLLPAVLLSVSCILEYLSIKYV